MLYLSQLKHHKICPKYMTSNYQPTNLLAPNLSYSITLQSNELGEEGNRANNITVWEIFVDELCLQSLASIQLQHLSNTRAVVNTHVNQSI